MCLVIGLGDPEEIRNRLPPRPECPHGKVDRRLIRFRYNWTFRPRVRVDPSHGLHCGHAVSLLAELCVPRGQILAATYPA